jgi:hypothetical protein
MISRRRVSRLVFALAGLISAPQSQAQVPFGGFAPVQGQLISRNQGPVPGVTVFLLHPVLGRSAPSVTDGYGRFGWSAIPIRREQFFLEIYWGERLIYRQPLMVVQPVFLPPIYL